MVVFLYLMLADMINSFTSFSFFVFLPIFTLLLLFNMESMKCEFLDQNVSLRLLSDIQLDIDFPEFGCLARVFRFGYLSVTLSNTKEGSF